MEIAVNSFEDDKTVVKTLMMKDVNVPVLDFPLSVNIKKNDGSIVFENIYFDKLESTDATEINGMNIVFGKKSGRIYAIALSPKEKYRTRDLVSQFNNLNSIKKPGNMRFLGNIEFAKKLFKRLIHTNKNLLFTHP